jgi:hypothetical protein
MNMSRFPMRYVRAAFFCSAVLLASRLPADAAFLQGLSAEETSASGVSKLTPPQAAALDGLVDQDVTLAHQGGITGFSSAFTARHTEKERKAAGIDRLSEQERSVLDSLAARAIALGPPPSEPYAYSPPKPTPTPTPRSVPSAQSVSAVPPLEVHGDVSFTVGSASHGRSFYGTSMDVNVTDPTGRFTVAVGFDDYRGKGLLGLYGPYGPGGAYYYGGAPFLGW